MNRFVSRFAMPLSALAFSFSTAIAGPGHDHGDEAPAVPSGRALPKFEAHSDLFEVVGVMEGRELSVFIDRYADNDPVLKAQVELESGSSKVAGAFREDSGEYKFDAAAFEKPGEYPLTITVASGEDVDILAANLVVPDEQDKHGRNESGHSYEMIGTAAVALILLAVVAFAAQRIKKSRAGRLK